MSRWVARRRTRRSTTSSSRDHAALFFRILFENTPGVEERHALVKRMMDSIPPQLLPPTGGFQR
jgi:hypothetical protein